jgi:outer membrane immunogenic protein
MKRLLVAAALAGIAAMTTTASAAPRSTAASTIAEPSWSGFYFGGDVAATYQHGRDSSNFFQSSGSLSNNPQERSPSNHSPSGGFYLGFNWQLTPAWLLGVEGDWQWTRLRNSYCRQTDIFGETCSDTINVGRGFATVDTETRSFGTVRGRLGWTFSRWMVYGTGGIALANIQNSLGLNCLVAGCGASGASQKIATTANSTTHKTGWVVGAGIERMLGENWLVRAEYLHAEFGSISNTLILPTANCNGPPCGLSWSRDFRYDVVRLGVGYKFGDF